MVGTSITMTSVLGVTVGGKVSVDDLWFGVVLWVRGGEVGVREFGTRREDVYPVSRLRARGEGRAAS